MTKIERAIRAVSDMREFYRRIPKVKASTIEAGRKPGKGLEAARRTAGGLAGTSDQEHLS